MTYDDVIFTLYLECPSPRIIWHNVVLLVSSLDIVSVNTQVFSNSYYIPFLTLL